MQNIMETNPEYKLNKWSKDCIGEGEWVDWKNIVEELQNKSEMPTYLSYDNLNIKLYAYAMDEIQAQHSFGDADAGGYAGDDGKRKQ